MDADPNKILIPTFLGKSLNSPLFLRLHSALFGCLMVFIPTRSWGHFSTCMTPHFSNMVLPDVRKKVEAAYPEHLLETGLQIEVVLDVTIDIEGRVSEIRVAKSGGEPFDKAATLAMQNWIFWPARLDGKPIASKIRVPFHFSTTPKNISEGDSSNDVAPSVVPSEADGSANETGQNADVSSTLRIKKSEQDDQKRRSQAPLADPTSAKSEEVHVTGRSSIPSRGAGDYELPVGKLALVPRADAGALLRMAPGVMLTNEGGTGHPYQIFLRGFDAREGQDLELSVEGVPVNEVGNPHGNGLADTHFILPELVTQLRVIEGSFAPQQGNFAVAGSALYSLGLKEEGFKTKLTFGSFATKRALLLWRPGGGSERNFGGVELFSSDGFGQNRASQRISAMAGYEFSVGKVGKIHMLATAYGTHYSQAGVLRDDDVQNGRKGFYDTYDGTQGGDSARHSISATYTDRFGDREKGNDLRVMQSFFLVYRNFRLRENFTGFLLDPQQSWQRTHVQRGDLIDQQSQSTTFGARGSARKLFSLFERKQEVELGYFARYDSVDALSQRDRYDTNVPYRTDLKLASALTNIAMYGDATFRILKWLQFRGGFRGDLFLFKVHNTCALTAQSSFGGDLPDTECFSSDRSGYRSSDQTASTSAVQFQPKTSVHVGPFSGFTASLSYGHGSRSLDPQYINQDLKTPFVSIQSAEMGMSYLNSIGDFDVQARSIFFRTHVDRDLFFNEAEGRNTLSDGTSRTGFSGSFRVTGRFLDVASSLTLTRSVFDDTGLAVPYAPGVVFRFDGALFGDLPLRFFRHNVRASLALGSSYIGKRPLPYNEYSDTIFLLDSAVELSWRNIAIGASCTNLFNSQYKLGQYNYVSDFRSQPYATRVASRHFSAGEPRAIYFSLTFKTSDGD